MQKVYKETMRKIINRQAEMLYRKLDLKPGFDVLELVESLGGEICQNVELDESTEAKICNTEECNSFKIECKVVPDNSDTYARFSIAHELGHLFLHMAKVGEDGGYILEGDFARRPPCASMIEWEAEEFAAAVLMPESVFRREIELVWQSEVEDKIRYLAELFKVPYKSIITRGKSLEIW